MKYLVKYKIFENHSFEKTYVDYDEILEGYLEAAIWADSEEDDETLSIYDFDEESKFNSRVDIIRFVKLIKSKLEEEGLILGTNLDLQKFGHNFWLTRQGHGAGFWDDPDYKDVSNFLCEIIDKYFKTVYYYKENGVAYIDGSDSKITD